MSAALRTGMFGGQESADYVPLLVEHCNLLRRSSEWLGDVTSGMPLEAKEDRGIYFLKFVAACNLMERRLQVAEACEPWFTFQEAA
jgi:hypothetical protein